MNSEVGSMMKIPYRVILFVFSSTIVLSFFGQPISADGQAGNLKPKQKTKIIKTIRPLATLHYVSYEEMKAQADIIFVGETEKSLIDLKGTIIYAADKIHILDYHTIRKIKVKKIIKNTNQIGIQKEKELNILEYAVIFNQQDGLYRLIQEDYVEILPENKYYFLSIKQKITKIFI